MDRRLTVEDVLLDRFLCDAEVLETWSAAGDLADMSALADAQAEDLRKASGLPVRRLSYDRDWVLDAVEIETMPGKWLRLSELPAVMLEVTPTEILYDDKKPCRIEIPEGPQDMVLRR
jgi:hypothetical protein